MDQITGELFAIQTFCGSDIEKKKPSGLEVK